MSEIEDLKELKAAMVYLKQSLGGCSSGLCCINGRANGMHTNTGCRCLRGVFDLSLRVAELVEPYKNRSGIDLSKIDGIES